MKTQKKIFSIPSLFHFALHLLALLDLPALVAAFTTGFKSNLKSPYSLSSVSSTKTINGKLVYEDNTQIINRDTGSIFQVTPTTFFSENGKMCTDICTGNKLVFQGDSTFFRTNPYFNFADDGKLFSKGSNILISPGEDNAFSKICNDKFLIKEKIEFTLKEDVHQRDLLITATGEIINMQTGTTLYQMNDNQFSMLPNGSFRTGPTLARNGERDL